MWVIESQPPDSKHRKAIDAVAALNGPVVDVEGTFTDLDLGRGPFQPLTEDQRCKLRGSIRDCLRSYFKSLCDQRHPAPRYEAFANRIERGDVVITFNYDVSLENELIRAHKFRVRNGYGSSFEADWDEPGSDVKLLKLHGSINWIGLVFGGATGGYAAFVNSLGPRPFVDNVDSVLPDYPSLVLDKTFRAGGVTPGSTTLVLPTYEKRFSIPTSVGEEWVPFYESLGSQAVEALQRSDRIIIGYSRPAAYRRSRALLLWNNNKQARVLVCCASAHKELRVQFEEHGFWRVAEAGTFADLFPQ